MTPLEYVLQRKIVAIVRGFLRNILFGLDMPLKKAG